MHPGFMGWLRRQHAEYHAAGMGMHAEGPWEGRHHCRATRHAAWHASHSGFDEGGGFGVRRPLRFLAYKLNLREEQVGQLAAILDRLKTERAQAEVDNRRRTASFADAFEATTFDQAKIDSVNEEQAKSAERLRLSVKTALAQMYELLDPEQRARLAYLLRAGILSI
jgi:Spy/CpxP family protein refolding chaperone